MRYRQANGAAIEIGEGLYPGEYLIPVGEALKEIHGDALRCTTDQTGRCLSVDLCNSSSDWRDDCLDLAEERAWSSPIFVDYSPSP